MEGIIRRFVSGDKSFRLTGSHEYLKVFHGSVRQGPELLDGGVGGAYGKDASRRDQGRKSAWGGNKIYPDASPEFSEKYLLMLVFASKQPAEKDVTYFSNLLGHDNGEGRDIVVLVCSRGEPPDLFEDPLRITAGRSGFLLHAFRKTFDRIFFSLPVAGFDHSVRIKEEGVACFQMDRVKEKGRFCHQSERRTLCSFENFRASVFVFP